ncbi:InlB B-repeat-containing protein [Butyrivibrio sp. MC2021]|uniref:InlB B-repeat-containing protein n=1 Tax=Butyrivibrio sp. MC2021 TaxID=1408306 RepID=UPI00047C3032|nr:InlB B-repeat-containing protein [Butyrivibrio sp. MC2021]
MTKKFKYSDEVKMFDLYKEFGKKGHPEPYYSLETGKGTTVYSLSSVNTKANGKGKKYLLTKGYSKLSTGASPSEYLNVVNLDLYCQWGKTQYYSISYDCKGGSLKNPVYAYSSAKSLTLPKPTRADYKFTGWKPSKKVSTATVVTKGTSTTIKKGSEGNLEFEATWEAVKKKK